MGFVMLDLELAKESLPLLGEGDFRHGTFGVYDPELDSIDRIEAAAGLFSEKLVIFPEIDLHRLLTARVGRGVRFDPDEVG